MSPFRLSKFCVVTSRRSPCTLLPPLVLLTPDVFDSRLASVGKIPRGAHRGG